MGSLSENQKDFIVEHGADGFEPDEISYLFKEQEDLPITEDTIGEYLESQEGQNKVDIRQRVRQKKANVTREELLEDLVNTKDRLKQFATEMQEEGHGVTSNEAYKNLLNSIEKLGKFIGELEQYTTNNNMIMINEAQEHIQDNFQKVAKFLPEEQKRAVVNDLTDELGLVVKKKTSKKHAKKQ